jgi:hypothetical protein
VHDIVILAGEHPWTWALANAVRRHFGAVPVVLERPPSKLQFCGNGFGGSAC